MNQPPEPPQSLLAKLQAQVTVRPRWRFVLEHALAVVALAVAAIALVYLGSLLVFVWRAARLSALPAFGAEGYGVLLRSFPWWQLGIVLVGIAALIYLLRRGTPQYRWPLAVTVGVLLAAFLTASAVTTTTGLHDRLANRAQRGGGIPLVGPLYRGGAVRGLVTPGEITAVGRSNLAVRTGEESITVEISEDTHVPRGWEPEVGDAVVIVGERTNGTIEAIGIHPADELPDRPPFRLEFRPPLPPDAY